MSEPIYNAKVNKIIELLKFMNRDEAAAKLNYKNYKSLDMYMRRKNFTFDPEEQQYVPMQTRVEKMKKDPKSYAPTKVVSIITAFEEEGVDPKVVAKQAGFNDHKEMAEYMKAKGNITKDVELVLPAGVISLGQNKAKVTIVIEPVEEEQLPGE
jgi:hypothetical protein